MDKRASSSEMSGGRVRMSDDEMSAPVHSRDPYKPNRASYGEEGDEVDEEKTSKNDQEMTQRGMVSVS